MTGILLVCHAPLGSAFNQVALHVLGCLPKKYSFLDVYADCVLNAMLHRLDHRIRSLAEDGEPLILLSDMTGGTPHNLLVQAALNFKQMRQGSKKNYDIKLLSNINMPAFLKIISCQNMHPSLITHNEFDNQSSCAMHAIDL